MAISVAWGVVFSVALYRLLTALTCSQCGRPIEEYGGGGYWRHVGGRDTDCEQYPG